MSGNTQRIDDLVDLPSVEGQLKSVQKLSADTQTEFISLLKTTNDLNAALSKVGNTSQFKKVASEAEASAQKTVAAQGRVLKAEQERIRLEEKRQRIIRESTQAEIAAANANRQGTISTLQNTSATAANANAATAATAANQRYGVQARVTATAIAQETGSIAANTAAVETNTAVQASGLAKIGQGLTKGLGYLRTLAYILPGIGVAGIFTLAFEGISALGDKLFNTGEKFDAFALKMKALNDVYKNSNREIAEQSTQLKYLYASATDVNNAMDERLQSAKKLQEEYPKTFGLQSQENIINGEAIGIYKTLTEEIIKNAKAKAAQNKIAEEEAKILDAEIKILKIGVQNRKEVAQFEKQRQDIIAKTQQGGAGFRGGLSTTFANEITNSNLRAAAELKTQTQIINSAKNNVKAIETLLGGATAIGNGINNSDGNSNGNKPKDTAAEDELKALEYQYNQQIELARALDKENLELAEEYLKQIESARKAAQERALNNEKIGAAERLLILDKDKQDVLAALADQYSKGLISTAAYEQQKKEIEYQYQADAVQNAIDLAQELINVKKAFGEDTTNDELELAKLQMKLSEQVTNKKISDLEKEAAKRKEINAAIKNLAEEAANFVIALVDAGFTNRKNQLRAEQDQLEERTSQEIAAVDRSLGTEQQKADKIAVINAKAQAEKDKIAKQQRAIDVEKAKFDKAVAIARIIENTAIGITNALASANIPLAVLIGAIGAVQLGTVLAQPIPQYAKGTKNAKGGLSIVGEQGRELIETPNGKSFLSAGTASLINLPAGSKVTPHQETMRMIGRPENLAGYKDREEVPWRELIAAIERNKPTKQGNKINVNVDAGFYIYRENHFR